MIFCRKSALIALLLVISVVSNAQNLLIDSEYIASVEKERTEKNREFIEDENSPLDSIKKKEFPGLGYFGVDPKWRVSARMEKYSNPDTLKMKTTTERLPLYLVYGKAYFWVEGKEFALTIYRNVGLMSKPGYEDYLFVPFRDESSGQESYGGGRYIDAREVEGDSIVIDFNKAYNPYCVYSKKYSCPVPPAENFLELLVTAGEKDFKH
ncbi:MAG: DUF1684 domain-containing protein [Bacteroidales bacterium]|nr:DUF1684 domain-containing protein [Bacteroidales bacterium]